MAFDLDENEAAVIAAVIELLMSSDMWNALPLAQRATVRTVAQELAQERAQERNLWPGQSALNLR